MDYKKLHILCFECLMHWSQDVYFLHLDSQRMCGNFYQLRRWPEDQYYTVLPEHALHHTTAQGVHFKQINISVKIGGASRSSICDAHLNAGGWNFSTTWYIRTHITSATKQSSSSKTTTAQIPISHQPMATQNLPSSNRTATITRSSAAAQIVARSRTALRRRWSLLNVSRLLCSCARRVWGFACIVQRLYRPRTASLPKHL